MSELVVFPVAIGDYLHHQALDVNPEVARVAELFGEFGGREVPWAVTMPDRGADATAERLRAWSATQGGNTVLYWVGHGWSDTRTASLAHARSPRAVAEDGVTPTALARRIAAREGAGDGWAIVIVDACRSARFVELLNAAVDNHQGPRRLLLVGVSGEGATTLGRFTNILETVLRNTFRTDSEIELWRLWPELKRNLPGGEVLPRNIEREVLRRTIAPVAGAATLDVLAEVETILAKLTDDEQRHFVPKAQGAELGELSWYFEGRHTESARIAAWLRAQTSGLLIVTGDAGSGKSALLGHLVVQSRPQLRTVLKQRNLADERPVDERPPDEVFDAVLHLTGLGPAEVIRRLAADLAVDALPAEAELRAQVDRLCAVLGGHRRTMLVDALDEAVSPLTIARSILQPLAAVLGVRVIVGTRRSTLEGPDQPHPDDQDLLDALGPADTTLVVERDDTAITRYVARRLATAMDRLQADQTTIQAAAAAIGDAGQQFLFARLAVHEILARPDLLTGPSLAELVAGDHRRLFATAVARLSTDQPVHGPLLQALAYSRGRGLPIRDGIWIAVASALSSGDEITDTDAGRLLDAAAPYVMLDREHGQTVYRLAHRTFAEHFTTEPDATDEMRPGDRRRHHAITLRLITDAAADPAAELNPYLTAYLSVHAGAAGEDAWHYLADHPGVLDRLDPLAVGADAMRTAFGRFLLPPEIAGVVGARHLLAQATPHDRAGPRQLAMARHAGITHPGTRGGSDSASWTVRWASVLSQPTHLTLTGHTRGVHAMCVVADLAGSTLLATASNTTVRLWDPTTGTPVGEPLTGHNGPIRAVCAVPGTEGRTLLVIASRRRVQLWDPGTGTPFGRPLRRPILRVRAVCAVPWPNGRTLLAAAIGSRVHLLDPATATSVGKPLTGHNGPILAMCTVPWPDGRTWLATGGADGTVRLWDPAHYRWFRHRMRIMLRERTCPVPAVCVVSGAEGHTLLATGSQDGTVRLWDAATGTLVRAPFSWSMSGLGALCAVPGPDGRTRLVTGGLDGTARLWDLAPGTPRGEPLTGHTGPVWSVCAVPVPDGRTRLVTGSQDGTVRLWDPAIGTPKDQSLAGHTGQVKAVCVVPGPDGRTRLATGSQDGTVRLWDPVTGTPTGEPFIGHTGPVEAVCAVSGPDGRTRLATRGSDGTVLLWDPATGTPIGEPFAVATNAVCTVPWPAGPIVLAIAGQDGMARLCDPSTGVPVCRPLRLRGSAVRAICAVPDPLGRILLATASEGPELSYDGLTGPAGWVQLWDPVANTKIGDRLCIDKVEAMCAVPTSDGGSLLAAASGQTVLLWDWATSTRTRRHEFRTLTGHTGLVRAVCPVPRPDKRTLLATGSDDGTVRLWDPDPDTPTTPVGVLQVGVKVSALCVLPGGSLAIATAEGVAVLVVRMISG